MLGENPPSQRDASEQDLATRLQSEGGGSVESHGVGRVGAVGPDRFRKGSGKLGERAFSGRRRFSPIKPSGKHKRVDDLDLALSLVHGLWLSALQSSVALAKRLLTVVPHRRAPRQRWPPRSLMDILTCTVAPM